MGEDDEISRICGEVEGDWQAGGLTGGIYESFAVEVAKRYANRWRSAQTAPRDGSEFLVWGSWRHDGAKQRLIVRWKFDEWLTTDQQAGGSVPVEFAEWMPLPEEPKP